MNILVTCSSTITALNVIRSLAAIPDVSVFSCDIWDRSPAEMFVKKNSKIQKATSETYVECILAICLENKISLLISTNDAELRKLNDARDILSTNGITLQGPKKDSMSTCLDKLTTSYAFDNAGVRTPKILHGISDSCVIRSRFAGLKKYCQIVSTTTDRDYFDKKLSEDDDMMMTSFISGTEFTIDTFATEDLKTVYVVPRERTVVNRGMVQIGRTVHDEEIISECRKIVLSLELIGMCCIQCIKAVDGKNYYFEVNPRPGSGMDLSIAAGVDMPRCLVMEKMGLEIPFYDRFSNMSMMRTSDGFYYET